MSTQPTFTALEWSVLRDPCASYWLKDAIKTLNGRDPLDAALDVKTLMAAVESRLTPEFFSTFGEKSL